MHSRDDRIGQRTRDPQAVTASPLVGKVFRQGFVERGMPEQFLARPCVGCGYCCTVMTCHAGALKYGPRTGGCPALTFMRGRYWCGLVLDADAETSAALKRALSVGAGCSSSLCNPKRERMLIAPQENQPALPDQVPQGQWPLRRP